MTDLELVKNLRYQFLRQSKSFSDDVVLRNPMSILDFARICTLENELWPVNDERRNNFCKKSDNLFTHQITEFIQRNLFAQRMGVGKKKPLVLKIHGHASSGKSTAIQQISKYLRDEVNNETVPLLPIYSEFQSAEKSFNLHSTSIWDRFVAGTQSIDFRFDPSSKSIESFKKFTSESNVLPLLIIDTVDFLAIPKEENIGTDWSSFLDELIKSNINVIFTVRTNEWELNFDRALSRGVRNCMASIALPELMLSEIDNYDFEGATNQKKFNQFTRVLGAFLPMLRNKSIISKPGGFSLEFFGIIDEWFESHTNNPTKALEEHPIPLFYNLSWRQIGNESSTVVNFKRTFENYVLEEISKHFSTYNSGRIFFDEYEFYQFASQEVPIDECEELFDDLVDLGIIRRVGKLFEFHHHLFVEHIIEQNPDAVPPGMSFEFDRGDERLYGCVKAWCDDKRSKIAHKHERRVHEFYPRAKYDLAPEQEEEQEHKLLKFFSDDKDKRRIQLLSGSAGTGKSIYSLKFIDHQFHYRTTAARACYITKSEELLQSIISRWKNREKDGILRKYKSDWDDGKRNHKVEFESVRKLLQSIVQEETTKKKFVDFEEFSSIWKEYWDGKRGYDSSRDSTSIEIAWLELNESFFNEYGQEIPKPEFKYTLGEDSKSKGLTKFKQDESIAPYSHWAYLARERILKDKNQSFNSYDFIVVDEVQDLHPSVVAFLMLLIRDPVEQENSKKGSIQLRKNIALKQLLLTGDEYQTLNQSGFDWVKLLERVQMISQKEKFDKHSILIDKWNDINLSSQDGSIFLEVLKYSYRNPQSIVSFNRSAFRSYNLAFDSILNSETTAKFTEDKFAKFETIVPRKPEYKPAKIVFIPITDNNFAEVIKHLNDVLWLKRVFLGSPQLLYPHHIDFDQLTGLADQKSLDDFASRMKIYSSGGVKGLETGAVCVMHPFEMDKSSFVPGKQQERKFSVERYDNQVNSQSKQLMERIHENMVYRMNVLFTRSESLIFIFWPGGLGEESSEFWWENDRYMRRVYPWSFNNLKRLKDVNIVKSYLDVNEEYLDKIFEGYKIELGAEYWERQALEALIRKDDDENQKKAFEQYFENVPEDQRNIGHTIALFSGYSNHFLIPTLFGPQDPDLNVRGNKIPSLFRENVSKYGILDDQNSLLKIFDSIYLDENSPLVSKQQKLHFEVGALPSHFPDGNHPYRTPSDYLTIIHHLYDFITNVLLKDREYLEKTEFGDRAILTIVNRFIPWSPFDSVKEFDNYMQHHLRNLKVGLSKESLKSRPDNTEKIVRNDTAESKTEMFTHYPSEYDDILSIIIGSVDVESGVIPISNLDPYPNQTIPYMITFNIVETIFRLSRISIHTRKFGNQLSGTTMGIESIEQVNFWEFLNYSYHFTGGINIKKFHEYVLAQYRATLQSNEFTKGHNHNFRIFFDSHVSYIRKNPQTVFREISKQDPDYNQPCFEILVENLIKTVEIPEAGISWKDTDYDWADIEGMYLVTPLLIMNTALSHLLKKHRYSVDVEIMNMIYDRIYRELKILEHGILPTDEAKKSAPKRITQPLTHQLANLRSVPIEHVLLCYQSFIAYLIDNRPTSQYIARTNDIIVNMIQSIKAIEGNKIKPSLSSNWVKDILAFGKGIYESSERQFGRYVACSIIMRRQTAEKRILTGLFYPSNRKELHDVLNNAVGNEKLTTKFAKGLIGALKPYMNEINENIRFSLTDYSENNKPEFLIISEELKELCKFMVANELDEDCIRRIRNLYGDIRPPVQVNLEYVHGAGDLDGWSILNILRADSSQQINKRIQLIFKRRLKSIVDQLNVLSANRDKELRGLEFIFNDFNDNYLQGNNRNPLRYYKEIKNIFSLQKAEQINFNEWQLSSPCKVCGIHRSELNWERASLSKQICNNCNGWESAADNSDYLLSVLFALHQTLSNSGKNQQPNYIHFVDALNQNLTDINSNIPIVSNYDDFFTSIKFKSHEKVLKSFRQAIKTPYESILVKIADLISNEYDTENKIERAKQKWLNIFDRNYSIFKLEQSYKETGNSVLLSTYDSIILSILGCSRGGFFEIKEDDDVIYNHSKTINFVGAFNRVLGERKALLDIELGRTGNPFPEKRKSIPQISNELKQKMEKESQFDESTSKVLKNAAGRFAGHYWQSIDNSSLNIIVQKYVEKMPFCTVDDVVNHVIETNDGVATEDHVSTMIKSVEEILREDHHPHDLAGTQVYLTKDQANQLRLV